MKAETASKKNTFKIGKYIFHLNKNKKWVAEYEKKEVASNYDFIFLLQKLKILPE